MFVADHGPCERGELDLSVAEKHVERGGPLDRPSPLPGSGSYPFSGIPGSKWERALKSQIDPTETSLQVADHIGLPEDLERS